MGVHGLWEAISSAEKQIPLVDIATTIPGHEDGLRVAIDVSLWLFHVKSGREGANPGLRTFFFRLCKLLMLGIRPVFVFDGPNKPPFKRGKRTTSYGHTGELQLYVDLIKAFGFPVWHASGEAEAECAALEKQGYVDAIMTDDVDVLLFGGRKVIRNWKLDGGKEATHIITYDMKEIEANGLDKAGILLVALMSGGDYLPSGVQNCGIKSAIELARAGWGTELVQGIDGNLDDWRERLEDELHNNPRKSLTRKRPSCVIPRSFPDRAVVMDYLHPKVNVGKVTPNFTWTAVDVNMLAIFTMEIFRWSRGTMLGRLRNSVFPAMIVQKMRSMDEKPKATGSKAPSRLVAAVKKTSKENVMLTSYFKATKNIVIVSESNSGLKSTNENKGDELPIVNIRSSRIHAKTGNQTEFRVEMDLSAMMTSVIDFLGPAPTLSSQVSTQTIHESDGESSSEQSSEADTDNDTTLHRIWVLESICRKAIPDLVSDFERRQETKAKSGNAKKKSKCVDPKGQALMSGWLRKENKNPQSQSDPFNADSSKTAGSQAFLQSITPKEKPTTVDLITPPQEETNGENLKSRLLTYGDDHVDRNGVATSPKALRSHATTPPPNHKSRKSPYKRTPKTYKGLNVESKYPTPDRPRPSLSDLEIVDISHQKT